MEVRNFNIYFFFILFLVVGVTVFLVFQPFLTAVVAAAVLSVILRPIYRFFGKLFPRSSSVSSLLTCFTALLIIVTPILLVFSLAMGEASHLYETVSQEHKFSGLIRTSVENLHSAPYLKNFLSEETLNADAILADIQRFSQNAVSLLEAAYTSVTHFVFWVFVMFFTLYYFLIDGHHAFQYLMRLSPLKNEHEKLLADKFIAISRATLKGTLIIGIIQGLLGGLAFWIVSIPSPAIWGLLMILFSIIPLVGSSIVWLPAAVILLILGQVWQGVFLLFVGFGVLSAIEHILRPKLVGGDKDAQMHPLMVFFATLGGISFFGLPGFIIGPILVSLFLALSEIYSMEFKSQLNRYNG